MIEPVVAALAAWWLLNEKMSFLQACGSFLVVTALFLNAKKA
jgi:drug/metabolite transporter (DMT)-like permease